MSEQRQCVVVGTDGTLGSDAAVRFAVLEARLHRARLILVTAYDRPIDPDVDDFDIPDDQLQQRARDEASESLLRAADIPVEELPDYEIIAGGGDPAKLLLSSADGAVMIVIGSHDATMLQRLFSRNPGRELRHGTHVPLVVVPPPVGDLSLSGPTPSFGRIVTRLTTRACDAWRRSSPRMGRSALTANDV